MPRHRTGAAVLNRRNSIYLSKLFSDRRIDPSLGDVIKDRDLMVRVNGGPVGPLGFVIDNSWLELFHIQKEEFDYLVRVVDGINSHGLPKELTNA